MPRRLMSEPAGTIPGTGRRHTGRYLAGEAHTATSRRLPCAITQGGAAFGRSTTEAMLREAGTPVVRAVRTCRPAHRTRSTARPARGVTEPGRIPRPGGAAGRRRGHAECRL